MFKFITSLLSKKSLDLDENSTLVQEIYIYYKIDNISPFDSFLMFKAIQNNLVEHDSKEVKRMINWFDNECDKSLEKCLKQNFRLVI